jgi:hypothetical protein
MTASLLTRYSLALLLSENLAAVAIFVLAVVW